MLEKSLFAERVKRLRRSMKVTQDMLAELLGVTRTQISDIENGKTTTTLERICVLANYFNVSLDFLTGRVKYLKDGEPYMDKSDVCEIFETVNAEQVNQYLRLGWRLIETVKEVGAPDLYIGSSIHYSLGWSSASGAPVHPAPEPPQKIDDAFGDDLPF